MCSENNGPALNDSMTVRRGGGGTAGRLGRCCGVVRRTRAAPRERDDRGIIVSRKALP
jgi:hypothetical protein